MLRTVGMELGQFFERHDAAEELRRSEERYRALFDWSPLPMWVFDQEDARILEVNRAAVAHYGYDAEEFRRLTLYDLRPAEDSDRLREALREPDRSPVGIWRHRRKDGTDLEVDVHTHGVTIDGRAARLAVIRDVTETRRLQAQLLQAQKMEAVGQLAGGIAHDFNNLLTVIGGNAELAQLEEDLPQGACQALADIRDACDRAASLTRQLLVFGQKQAARQEDVELNGLVRGMERMLRRVVPENVRMDFRLAARPLTVHADPSQLEQVVLNLAVNARDAMPRGGTLVIETLEGAMGEGPGAEPVHPAALLAVTDTGAGMDAATLARIFEPFFTTKGSKGTGLGLATVYGIVRQCHGTVDVTSEPGEGTRFELRLPLRPDSGRLDWVESGAEPERASRTATILLVEDDVAIRELARRALAGQGHTVLVAEDPPAALALARDGDHPIDLLVTDVVMPEMSGPTLAHALQASLPGLKTLYVSGYSAQVAIEEGLLDAADALLPKPFSPSELARKVRTVLEVGSD
jgi:PAS domain S-box-containing protein